MGFVLSGGKPSKIVIESKGVRHDIAFTIDPVRQTPVIERKVSASEVTTGTRVTVKWPLPLKVSSLTEGPRISSSSIHT
jgi:hypothetical protein